MEFSDIQNRKILQMVSKEHRRAFLQSKNICSIISLTNFVKRRKEICTFPIVNSGNDTVRECLPSKFSRINMTKYLAYLGNRIFDKNYEFCTNIVDMEKLVMSDELSSSVFLRMSLLGSFEDDDFDHIENSSTSLNLYTHMGELYKLGLWHIVSLCIQKSWKIWFHRTKKLSRMM